MDPMELIHKKKRHLPLFLVLLTLLLCTGTVHGDFRSNPSLPELPFEFPFLAKISYKPLTARAKFARCTATVYNDLWLITSVRCAIPTIRRQNGRPTHDWGDVDFEGADHMRSMCRTGDPSSYRFITDVVVPPTSNVSLGGALNNPNSDIALLKLNKPLTFSNKLRPIVVAANQSDCLQPEYATFLGWGVRTAADGQVSLSDEQHMMQLKILPASECSSRVRGFRAESKLCAESFDLSERTCFSDTGGPLIVTALRKKYPEGALVQENILCGILPVSTCSRSDSMGDVWVEYFTKAYLWTHWIKSIAGRSFRVFPCLGNTHSKGLTNGILLRDNLRIKFFVFFLRKKLAFSESYTGSIPVSHYKLNSRMHRSPDDVTLATFEFTSHPAAPVVVKCDTNSRKTGIKIIVAKTSIVVNLS